MWPGPWFIQGQATGKLLEQLRTVPTLGEQLSCQLGVKTGANRVFLDAAVDVGDRYWRDAIRGRDVRGWRIQSKTRLLWPYDDQGSLRKRLPKNLRDYFESHASILTRRADYRGGLVWQLFRTGPTLAPHRVVWADLSCRLEAVPLVGKKSAILVPLNTCYVVGLSSRRAAVRLAAWLNSTWIRALAKIGADVARGGYARFNARAVGATPLPPAVLEDEELYSLGQRALRGDRIQEQLDALVSRTLSLSDAAQTALKRVE
jgi:hypothetical protein